MTRIAILVHRDQDFEGVGYYLYLRDIAAAWCAQAHEVIVVHGPDRRVPADLAILHVDP